jgi:uncharacterized phage protein gp47/JayE
MPYARPTLPTLIDRAAADIESRLPGADARLRRSNLNVLARVHAGATHGLYGYIDWLARQIIIDSAEADILERHASVWGVTRRPAAAASGVAQATGTDGTWIPAGTALSRRDGVQYVTVGDVMILSGTAQLSVVAVDPGQADNASPETVLNLASPLEGVRSSVAVSAEGLTGGADAESDESLRARLLARIRMPPMGGAAHDYVAWALEVPGVTRAWCYPGEMGDGTVTVRFVRDDDAYPIPDPDEVVAVQTYIDVRRPVTAHLYVVAPIPAPIDFEISVSPDTPSIRTAVEAELRDLLTREAVPEGGAGEGRIRVSHLREAISLAAGEYDHVLHSPASDVVLTLGQMATFGSISWV